MVSSRCSGAAQHKMKADLNLNGCLGPNLWVRGPVGCQIHYNFQQWMSWIPQR